MEPIEKLPGPVVDFLLNEFVGEQLEDSVAVIDIGRAEISVGDVWLGQEGQGVDYIFDKLLHILEGEESVGVEASLQELMESRLGILQEQEHAIIGDLHTAREGSGPKP